MVSDRLRLPAAARAAWRTSRSTPGKTLVHAGSSRTTLTDGASRRPEGLRLGFFVARVIGLDDPGHEIVAHDVLRGEPDEAHTVDVLQRLHGIVQARSLAAGQVGLAGIAGDHHARALAQAGQ